MGVSPVRHREATLKMMLLAAAERSGEDAQATIS